MHSTGKEAVLEFKVEPPVQVPQPAQAKVRSPMNGVSDFAAKIGLHAGNEQAGVDSSARIELYALSLRAGHHLSQVSHVFLADTIQPSLTPRIEDGTTFMADGSPETPALAAMSGLVAVAAVSLCATPSYALSSDMEASQTLREWARYLGSQWPERRWQLLTRPDGVELLVRDYHLSHEEQIDLVAELRARVPSSSPPPERIWLNGQVIWHAESVMSHSMTGGQHGG